MKNIKGIFLNFGSADDFGSALPLILIVNFFPWLMGLLFIIMNLYWLLTGNNPSDTGFYSDMSIYETWAFWFESLGLIGSVFLLIVIWLELEMLLVTIKYFNIK